ncbi:NAD(P)/FAD-dependent oxidoreductase [uncultured Alsobacter sp.]|uniref:NAD(P)/FAD-dependent oxidoreductase n=1 Tax=uncultured Alsobacter sp. TaxID=1748258 RepID=UPI0025F0D174|nr:NAD(P)/FAD-dependent oxidoreductase [uncultured Alsobacter sp.]
MTDVDATIVGAGVVGLAVARALALTGRSVLVLEAAEGIGTGTSSRNSEVIHAGLYYPTGSLKARMCVEGRRLLYAYCAERGIAHRKCGKLIVATDEHELQAVLGVARRGEANGVENLEMISGAAAMAMEPALFCVGALWSPETGIVDSHAYMLSMQGEVENAGGSFAFHTPFLRASAGGNAIAVETGGAEPFRFTTGLLVNAAGLAASTVGEAIHGLPAGAIPPTRYAKGNYFVLSGRAPFTRLIYPAPHTHGLGVHLTIDLGGQARFGPDVEWIEEPNYDVDPARGAGFDAEIRKYWPGLPENALSPGYAGIRPKIAGPKDPAPDFRIDGPREHGVPGVVNLLGIESPGLTSSMAIAEEVVRRIG